MKKAKLNLLTPVAELEWVDIEGRGTCFGADYDADKAKYTASIVLTKEQFEEPQKDGTSLKEKIDTFYKEHGKGGRNCYRDHEEISYAEDGSGETTKEKSGKIVIRAKTNIKYARSDKPNYVTVTDASGKPYPRGYFEDNKIGNGSKGRLSINLAPYDYSSNTGIAAYLVGLQLSNHIIYTGNSQITGKVEGDTDAESIAVAPEIEEPINTE